MVLIDLAFEAVSGVRVGGSRGDGGGAGTDAPVLRDRRGPVIPGSSLKGVLRSAAERLLAGVPADPPLACDVLASPCGGLPRAAEERQAVDLGSLCRVCRLFGSHWAAGRLAVGDLTVDGGQGAVTMVRDGVAIDRDELKARDGLKYDYEVVVPGTRFSGRLRVDDPEPGDLALLEQLLDLIDLGVVTVGGGASRGLGRLRYAAPPAARRLRASTWARGAVPEPLDLAEDRPHLHTLLQGAGA